MAKKHKRAKSPRRVRPIRPPLVACSCLAAGDDFSRNPSQAPSQKKEEGTIGAKTHRPSTSRAILVIHHPIRISIYPGTFVFLRFPKRAAEKKITQGVLRFPPLPTTHPPHPGWGGWGWVRPPPGQWRNSLVWGDPTPGPHVWLLSRACDLAQGWP